MSLLAPPTAAPTQRRSGAGPKGAEPDAVDVGAAGRDLDGHAPGEPRQRAGAGVRYHGDGLAGRTAREGGAVLQHEAIAAVRAF